MTKYPASDLDNAKAFLGSLGSFWTLAFSDSLEGLVVGQLELNWQAYINALEAAASISRFTVPIYHTRLWSRSVIRKSEMNGSAVAPLTYGTASATYGNTYTYNGAVVVANYRFPAPDDVVSVMQIVDRPIKPGISLIAGVDFTVNSEGGYIAFKEDPFASGKFLTRSTINPKTNQSDEEIELWLFKSSADLSLIYEQFGYALGMYFAESSENYRTLLNAVWDSMVIGPTMRSLHFAISAISGAPVIRNSEEIVETIILTDPRYQQIITDKEVYTVSKDVAITVAVNAVLHEGDFITDMAYIAEGVNAAAFFTSAGSPKFLITPDMFIGTEGRRINANLTVASTLQNVTYVVDGDGFTEVTMAGITGAAGDLTTFWANVNDVSKERGKSLAKALRSHPERTDEPTTWELPSQINTALFFVKQLFGNNVILLYLKDNVGLGSDALKYLRRLVPAHTHVLQCVA
jgi:hypothetical protein